MPTIPFHGTREQLLARLYALPACLAGRQADPTGACFQLMLTMGMGFLSAASENFQRAAEGGVNDLTGQPWAPLADVTLALRRKVSTPKAVGKLGAAFDSLSARRQRLIRVQYERVKALYEEPAPEGKRRRAALGILERMKRDLPLMRYKALRAELTKVHKPEKIKRLALAAAHALILRSTGRLLNSLSPALRGGGEQFFELKPGTLSVGTNVAYGRFHNSPLARRLKKDGLPRLPRRQFLPDGIVPMPSKWWKSGTDALMAGFRSPSFWATYLAS
jgi:hypothetical protein